MNIAIFSPTFLPNLDGVSTTLSKIIPLLKKRGHKVILFTPNRGLVLRDSTAYRGVEVVRLFGVPLPWNPDLKIALWNLPIIFPKLMGFKPDIVHIIDPWILNTLGMCAWLCCRSMGIPFITSYETHYIEYAHHYGVSKLCSKLGLCSGRKVNNDARMVLCRSKVLLTELRGHGFVSKMRVWPGAVDSHRIHPQMSSLKIRTRLSQGHPQEPLFLCVSRLGKEKHLDDARIILEKNPRARLAIVGHGPERKYLERHFKGTHTYFTGWMSGKALYSAFASADVFIMPSPTETFGLVVLEAMAAGLPVVGVKKGGITEIIRDGVNGYFYELGDIQRLGDLANHLIKDDRTRNKMAYNARKTAEDYSYEDSAKVLHASYKEVLS